MTERNPDVIVYEEEEGGRRPLGILSIIAGALIGAYTAYKLKTSYGGIPPIQPGMVVNGETGQPIDVELLLISGMGAAIGAAVGAWFDKKRRPRRVRLRHYD